MHACTMNERRGNGQSPVRPITDARRRQVRWWRRRKEKDQLVQADRTQAATAPTTNAITTRPCRSEPSDAHAVRPVDARGVLAPPEAVLSLIAG